MPQGTLAQILVAPSLTGHSVGVVKVVTARKDRRRRGARLQKAARDYNAAIYDAGVVHDESLAEAGATLDTAFDDAAAAYNAALWPTPDRTEDQNGTLMQSAAALKESDTAP